MTRVILTCILLAGTSALAACGATVRAPAETPQMADALPPMMPVEELGSSNVQRPITGSCGMEDLQHYVGRARTTVPRDVLPPNFRVLGPDTVTTMEYRADRLTVRIDGRDRIESISCG